MKHVKIVLKPAKAAKGAKKTSPVAPHAGLLELDLGFVMGAETWYYYIKELKEGNLVGLNRVLACVTCPILMDGVCSLQFQLGTPAQCYKLLRTSRWRKLLPRSGEP